MSCSVYKNGKKKGKMSVFLRARDPQMSCFVQTQRYSVYCHRGGKKTDDIQVKEAGIWSFGPFSEKEI